MLWEASPWSLAGAAAAVALLWLAAWTLEWAWWTPRRLGLALRAQGLRGTRYRLFTGDVARSARLNREARSKPLPLGSHDIIPRVLPMFCNAIKEHGNISTRDSFPPSKNYSSRFQYRYMSKTDTSGIEPTSLVAILVGHTYKGVNRKFRACIRLQVNFGYRLTVHIMFLNF